MCTDSVALATMSDTKRRLDSNWYGNAKRIFGSVQRGQLVFFRCWPEAADLCAASGRQLSGVQGPWTLSYSGRQPVTHMRRRPRSSRWISFNISRTFPGDEHRLSDDDVSTD